MIDRLATRYGYLPSQVLKISDTFDVYTMDIASSYEQYAREKAEAEREGRAPVPQIPLNTLKEMMERSSDNKKD